MSGDSLSRAEQRAYRGRPQSDVGPGTDLIAVQAGSAPMSLHFDDSDPVAECHVKKCRWHGHGDSLNDAVTAWTAHLVRDHRGDWE